MHYTIAVQLLCVLWGPKCDFDERRGIWDSGVFFFFFLLPVPFSFLNKLFSRNSFWREWESLTLFRKEQWEILSISRMNDGFASDSTIVSPVRFGVLWTTSSRWVTRDEFREFWMTKDGIVLYIYFHIVGIITKLQKNKNK